MILGRAARPYKVLNHAQEIARACGNFFVPDHKSTRYTATSFLSLAPMIVVNYRELRAFWPFTCYRLTIRAILNAPSFASK